VDVIADTDSVQSWAFSMPRLKGKPVEELSRW
jgi:hexosaminidase